MPELGVVTVHDHSSPFCVIFVSEKRRLFMRNVVSDNTAFTTSGDRNRQVTAVFAGNWADKGSINLQQKVIA